ncbi:Fungalysin metallopeptidase-domain-containing protein [Syncephalis plumigaleata]|nr:Fungalysin metallopeptidase-domain-containing protein [Syncephalis plumigaleata]
MKIKLRLLILAAVSTATTITAEQEVNVKHIRPGPLANYATRVTSSGLLRLSRPFGNPDNPKDIAIKFVHSQLHPSDGSFTVKNAYFTRNIGVTHVYLKQLVHGIEVANGDFAVHVDSTGNVVAYSDNFHRRTSPSQEIVWTGQLSNQFVDPVAALKAVADYIGKPIDTSKLTKAPRQDPKTSRHQTIIKGVSFAVEDVLAQQSYVHTTPGTLEAAWEFFVRMRANYFHVHVSADGTKVLALNDWTSSATYNVLKLSDKRPDTSARTLVTNPQDRIASPKGWHYLNGTETNTTEGNNAHALIPSYRPTTTPKFQPNATNHVFDFPLDLTKDPGTYKAAAVTNLFYITNMMHDIFYRYGFDEVAGNFQQDNFGKGGAGNDSVIAYAQDPDDMNNARFTTLPDGEHGEMYMFIWDRTRPMRDGDFMNEIVMHEYSHGISTRLTGGPANVDCLIEGESGGMGEGWSDFFAIALQMKSTDTRNTTYTMGEYVYGQNIRHYPYATSKDVNPTTYGLVYKDGWDWEHAIGEIWANILYEIYWNLVEKHGFTEDVHSADITKGNTLALQLVVNSMKLQPCNPTFITARDAIIQAEQLLTRGKNKCLLWSAFAKRGLGLNATTDGVFETKEDFTLPSYCTNK